MPGNGSACSCGSNHRRPFASTDDGNVFTSGLRGGPRGATPCLSPYLSPCRRCSICPMQSLGPTGRLVGRMTRISAHPVCGTTPSPKPRSVLKSSRFRLDWRTRAPLSAPLCVWLPPGLGSQTMTRGTRCGVRPSPASRCRGGAADQPLAQITRSHTLLRYRRSSSTLRGSLLDRPREDVGVQELQPLKRLERFQILANPANAGVPMGALAQSLGKVVGGGH